MKKSRLLRCVLVSLAFSIVSFSGNNWEAKADELNTGTLSGFFNSSAFQQKPTTEYLPTKISLYKQALKRSYTLSNPALQLLIGGNSEVTKYLSVKDHKHYIDGALKEDASDPKFDNRLAKLVNQANAEIKAGNLKKETVQCIESILDEYFEWPDESIGKDDQVKLSLQVPAIDFALLQKRINSPKAADYIAAAQHIHHNWQNLYRKTPEVSRSTLITLPKPYIIPGGRFREIYYWDSYFTILGLEYSGLDNVAKDMTENFMYMVEQFGFIPNGNRVYYLSRSQPPFLAMMVDEVKPTNFADPENKKWMERAYNTVALEYKHNWMNPKTNYVPSIGLNRYFDVVDAKRPESFAEDNLGLKLQKGFFQNERAECESGWDFSPRFNQKATDYIPVDLNSLLYKYEMLLAEWALHLNKPLESEAWLKRAKERKQLMIAFLYNPQDGGFYDYDFKNKKQSTYKSIAMAYPLWVGLFNKDNPEGMIMANKLKNLIVKEFESQNGISTSSKNMDSVNIENGKHESEYQWAFPNGWAPHQLITVEGFRKYGFNDDAKRIATKWIDTNTSVFKQNHKFYEKYNVDKGNIDVKTSYPQQDGFGWTNGVYLKLLNEVIAN